MKKLCEIITYIAVLAFVLSLCTMDNNPVLSCATILIAGGWIVGFSWCWEEERRRREGR